MRKEKHNKDTGCFKLESKATAGFVLYKISD